MEMRKVGQRLYNVLWNANVRNHDRPTYLTIEQIMSEINVDVKNIVTREQVIDVILNDPFRQADFRGVICENTRMFETKEVDGVLESVRLPELPYKYPKDWGLE